MISVVDRRTLNPTSLGRRVPRLGEDHGPQSWQSRLVDQFYGLFRGTGEQFQVVQMPR